MSTDHPSQATTRLADVLGFEVIPPQSPTSSIVMEAIATVFAIDVPRLALLVLPAGSSIKKSIAELQDLGVNAQPLDLRGQEIDELVRPTHSDEEPTMLVATPASIRGVDLPQLTHVFCAGAPDTASADVFKHVSGRVGRFGREGKVRAPSTSLRLFKYLRVRLLSGDDLCDRTRDRATRWGCADHQESRRTIEDILPQTAHKSSLV